MEVHPFIGKTKFKRATVLVLGSFPDFKQDTYGDWYFADNQQSYSWAIMADMYNAKFDSNQHKFEFCSIHNFAITDLFLKLERSNKSKQDQLKVVEYNVEELLEILNTNNIYKILFTSKVVESHFQILLQQKESLNRRMRNIITKLIPSPSAKANSSISRLKDFKQLKSNQFTTLDYRKKLYRKELIG